MNELFQPVPVVMTVAMGSLVLVRETVMTMMTAPAPFSVAAITVGGGLLMGVMTDVMLVLGHTNRFHCCNCTYQEARGYGGDDCCKGDCGVGEGDFDAGNLVWGRNNCIGRTFESDDCCKKP